MHLTTGNFYSNSRIYRTSKNTGVTVHDARSPVNMTHAICIRDTSSSENSAFNISIHF